MEIDDSLKQLISEILSLADSLSAEIMIGIRLNSWSQKTWATNGTMMRDALMIDGLRFDETDDFFRKTKLKDGSILEDNDHDLQHVTEEREKILENSNNQRMDLHDSLKQLISEILTFADRLSAEILIGVRRVPRSGSPC
jgi:uncharacterized protein (DUF488 family)